jgi:hypothetical protein
VENEEGCQMRGCQFRQLMSHGEIQDELVSTVALDRRYQLITMARLKIYFRIFEQVLYSPREETSEALFLEFGPTAG